MRQLESELKKAANPKQAAILQRFFKTGKGEYGEGDIFLGIKMSKQREIAKQFKHLSIQDIQKLLNSKIHEKRLISLLILIKRYEESGNKERERIFNLYLKNSKQINNWDLVDLSAPSIMGDFLLDKDKKILYELAKSENLWERRISIIATFTFIRNNQFEDTIEISKILLQDKHDLIHKTVGWMLREAGKKNQIILEKFLEKHYKNMPRTMLRYAIEKLKEERRKKYLLGEI